MNSPHCRCSRAVRRPAVAEPRSGADVTTIPNLDANLAPFAERFDELTALVARAAAAIVAVDPARVARRRKEDHSFVSAADEIAQATILEGLAGLFPTLAVVSEEAAGPQPPDVSRECFALVDPLDGTREFLEGRAEYTVNLAIVSRGMASIGIIAAPALGLIWRGISGAVAERLRFDAARPGVLGDRIAIRSKRLDPNRLRVIVSRSHLDRDTAALMARLPVSEQIRCGSSLKFCRLAEGAADVYPRLAPTSEWDIAAGDALLTAAGGIVTDPDGGRIRYGGLDRGFRVPAFLACADPAGLDRLLGKDRGDST